MEDIKNDSEIAVISDKVPSLQAKIEGLLVKDEQSSKLMTDYCGFLKDAITKVETKRKFYVAPMNEAVKRINNDAKAITEPLSRLLDIGKKKIMIYIEAARARERIATEEKQKRLDEFAKKNDMAPVKVEVEEQHQVKSGIGAAHTTKRWTWELLDITKVTDEYKVINETKINNMIRAHTQNVKGVSSCDFKLDGIRVYQDETVSIRT